MFGAYMGGDDTNRNGKKSYTSSRKELLNGRAKLSNL